MLSKFVISSRQRRFVVTAVASMRRTEALASVKFYQILSIFIFFIRLIILEDFIRLISYNGPCVRLGCSFFLATALVVTYVRVFFFLNDWTQPTRCVVNQVCVNSNLAVGLFNSFLSRPLKSMLKSTTISLGCVCEGQLWCSGTYVAL